MDALLQVWLEHADALLPTWRATVRNNEAIAILTSTTSKDEELATPDELFKLRESLELLALALQVDPQQFYGLIRSGAEDGSLLCAPIEKLQIRVQVDFSADTTSEGLTCWRGFFSGWHEATASKEYTFTKKKLLGGFRDDTKLELQLELRLLRSQSCGERLQLDAAVAFLKSLDQQVLKVTQIKVVIATAFLDASSFATLFQSIDEYTDTANVIIHLDISQPRDESVRLVDWKTVFDTTTRRQTDSIAKQKDWDIEVSTSSGLGFDGSLDDPTQDDARARVVAACVSALADADDHVSSITIHNLLEDMSERDCYKPTERRLRAKWLGYLLRVGRVEKLTVSEATFTHDDMDMIASTLQARSDEACLRALWNESWHQQKIRDLHHGPLSTRDDLKTYHTEIAHELVIKPRSIIGVMQDDDGHLVDVLVAGYGQCTIPRSLLQKNEQETSLNREKRSHLRSLTIRLSEGDGAEGHLLRLVMLAGKDLEELVIDATHAQIALSMFIIILASCPRLKRLEVKTIYLTTGDDEQLYLPSHWANHPLDELCVDLHLNDASIGLCGLASMLVLFGVHLKTLRIRAEPPMAINRAAISAMENMLRTCCQSLQRLEVVGLSVKYFHAILTPDALGMHQLETLMLTDAASNRSVWEKLMITLAASCHPLTQSLHTLRIHVQSFPEIAAMVATMLQANDKLVHCDLDIPRHMHIPVEELGVTNGRSLRRRKEPLTIRQKTAFLSSVQHSVLPWESCVLGKIFRFAAPTETRRVVVSTY